MNQFRPDGPSVDHLAEQITAVLADPATPHGLARTLRAAAKEIELSRYHRASQRAYPSGRIDSTPKRVQVGGGAHRIDGFFNIDLVPPADVLWDVREGLPLYDGSVETLFSEHFLEHIDYPISAKRYAREALRVLAPDGRLITGVPDAAFVLGQYPTGAEDTQVMIERWYAKRTCREDINTYLDLINYVFRDQDDDPAYTPHHWAYDVDKLRQLFMEAGFASVEPWEFDSAMANPKREWGSVYVVARR